MKKIGIIGGLSWFSTSIYYKVAQEIIFGCTEIALLINQSECPISVFDTTIIHANAAVDFALQ